MDTSKCSGAFLSPTTKEGRMAPSCGDQVRGIGEMSNQWMSPVGDTGSPRNLRGGAMALREEAGATRIRKERPVEYEFQPESSAACGCPSSTEELYALLDIMDSNLTPLPGRHKYPLSPEVEARRSPRNALATQRTLLRRERRGRVLREVEDRSEEHTSELQSL